MDTAIELFEKWTLRIHELKIGATREEGGTRGEVLKVGAQTTLPYLFREGEIPRGPIIAAEVFDSLDEDEWPGILKKELGPLLGRPLEWAAHMLKDAGADLVCLKLQGTHPDFGNKSAEEAAEFVQAMLCAINTPLVILGCGDHAKDNEILPRVSEAAKGERLLFGDALQENYKTLTAACLADGHNIIAESPIDINIAKQLNILISDLGMPLERIAVNPTIGALGYGLEYAYSIMERARIAGLSGDRMLAMPYVCFVGQETWRAKEAKVSALEAPHWGDERERGVMWEATTAMAMIQAGADILTMRHPQAIKIVKSAIRDLMGE